MLIVDEAAPQTRSYAVGLLGQAPNKLCLRRCAGAAAFPLFSTCLTSQGSTGVWEGSSVTPGVSASLSFLLSSSTPSATQCYPALQKIPPTDTDTEKHIPKT